MPASRFLAQRITHTARKSFGMYAYAASQPDTGRDLIHMELGMPSSDTPQHVKQATIAALLAGDVHYSDLQGQPRLRQALAHKIRSVNRIDCQPENLVVTNGLTHASYAAIMAVVDPGDEVILLEPYYPQHIGKIELAGGQVVKAPLDANRGFSIDPEAIAARITPATKAIVLVNPCNPTGRVYTLAELEGLAALAIRHDLLVLSDEVYEDIVYDGHRHISIAALPGMAERTITFSSFTKNFAMDGWRLGYLVAPPALVAGILKITANDATHVNTFIQAGGVAALEGPPAVLAGLVEEDRQKRDLLVARLNAMPGVHCPKPEGTIYAFADVRALGVPAQQLAEDIMRETGVVLEAGSFYGAAGEGHLRICFGAQSRERIAEAMDRLDAYFQARRPA